MEERSMGDCLYQGPAPVVLQVKAQKGCRNGVIGCRPTSYFFDVIVWCRRT